MLKKILYCKDNLEYTYYILVNYTVYMGFDCGQLVTVRHEKNKIIITVNTATDVDE